MVKSYSFSQNTFFLTTAYIFEKVLVFFYFIFLARYLGPENFGIYNFALSFVSLFVVLLDIGFTTVLIREAAKDKNKSQNYLENALAFKVFTSLITTLLIIIIINLLGYNITAVSLVCVFTFSIIFESFASTVYGFFRGLRNLRYESIGLLLNKSIYIALGLLFIFLKLPLYVFAIPLMIGGLFYFLYSVFASKKFFSIKIKFDRKINNYFLKISFPIVFSIIFATVSNSINIVLISYLASDKAAGLFSAAFRIPMALLFLPGAIGAAVFPVFSSLVREENRKRLSWMFEKVLFYMILLSLPLVFGGLILGDQIINVIYGSEFLEASVSFKILISISLFLFLDYVFSSVLTALDKQKENAISRGFGLLINIVLCFVLIPLLGQLGGAIAFVVGFLVFSIIQLFLIIRILSFNFSDLFKKGLLVLIASIIMGGIIFISKNQIHFLFSLILGVISYFLCLYLIGGIKKEDLSEIKRLVRSSFKKEPTTPIEGDLQDIDKI